MKLCNKCGFEKELNKFNKNKTKKDGYSYTCKECCKAIQHDYYKKNKSDIIEKVVNRKTDLRKWYTEFKTELKCIECGFDHPAAIDFHHIDPTKKEHNLHRMMQDGYGVNAIMKEIDKCIPLCSNCHRIHHYNERQSSTS